LTVLPWLKSISTAAEAGKWKLENGNWKLEPERENGRVLRPFSNF
jgi:hypothetical protein